MGHLATFNCHSVHPSACVRLAWLRLASRSSAQLSFPASQRLSQNGRCATAKGILDRLIYIILPATESLHCTQTNRSGAIPYSPPANSRAKEHAHSTSRYYVSYCLCTHNKRGSSLAVQTFDAIPVLCPTTNWRRAEGGVREEFRNDRLPFRSQASVASPWLEGCPPES